MSLHREFALTPEVFDPTCFESAGEHRLFMTLLKSGLSGLKFLRCDKNQWKLDAEKYASGSMTGNALLKYLIKNKRLLINDLPKSNQDHWLSYFDATHKIQPMAGILVDDLSDISNALTLPQARASEMTPDHPAWWFEDPQSMHINCSAHAISESLRVLLRNARSIHLIDQNFDPERPMNSKVLENLCLEITGNAHCNEVFIHTSCRHFRMAETSLDKQRLNRKRPSSLRKQTHLFVCAWDDCMMRSEAHDRYCLTDLGGCQLGQGFEHKPNAKTTVSALSEATCKKLLLHFYPDKNISPKLIFKTEF
jgi:hypothetical protein